MSNKICVRIEIGKDNHKIIEANKNDTLKEFYKKFKKYVTIPYCYYLECNGKKLLDLNEPISAYGDDIKLVVMKANLPYFMLPGGRSFAHQIERANITFRSIAKDMGRFESIYNVSFSFCGRLLNNDEYIINIKSSEQFPIIVSGYYEFNIKCKNNKELRLCVSISMMWNELKNRIFMVFPELAEEFGFDDGETYGREIVYLLQNKTEKTDYEAIEERLNNMLKDLSPSDEQIKKFNELFPVVIKEQQKSPKETVNDSKNEFE